MDRLANWISAGGIAVGVGGLRGATYRVARRAARSSSSGTTTSAFRRTASRWPAADTRGSKTPPQLAKAQGLGYAVDRT